MFKVLIAAIVGGLIFFGWNSFSWSVLPWHQQTVKHFDNEQLVAETLKANIPETGIYVIPKMNFDSDDNNKTVSDTEKSKKQEPFGFLSYRTKGIERSMEETTKLALGMSVLASIFIVILLSCTSELSYMARVLFVVMAGMIGALLGHVPNWIWWGFDTNYTIVMIADTLIGWFLASLVIAAFVGKESEYEIND